MSIGLRTLVAGPIAVVLPLACCAAAAAAAAGKPVLVRVGQVPRQDVGS